MSLPLPSSPLPITDTRSPCQVSRRFRRRSHYWEASNARRSQTALNVGSRRRLSRRQRGVAAEVVERRPGPRLPDSGRPAPLRRSQDLDEFMQSMREPGRSPCPGWARGASVDRRLRAGNRRRPSRRITMPGRPTRRVIVLELARSRSRAGVAVLRSGRRLGPRRCSSSCSPLSIVGDLTAVDTPASRVKISSSFLAIVVAAVFLGGAPAAVIGVTDHRRRLAARSATRRPTC